MVNHRFVFEVVAAAVRTDLLIDEMRVLALRTDMDVIERLAVGKDTLGHAQLYPTEVFIDVEQTPAVETLRQWEGDAHGALLHHLGLKEQMVARYVITEDAQDEHVVIGDGARLLRHMVLVAIVVDPLESTDLEFVVNAVDESVEHLSVDTNLIFHRDGGEERLVRRLIASHGIDALKNELNVVGENSADEHGIEVVVREIAVVLNPYRLVTDEYAMTSFIYHYLFHNCFILYRVAVICFVLET